MADNYFRYNPRQIVLQLEQAERLLLAGDTRGIAEIDTVIQELGKSLAEITKQLEILKKVNPLTIASDYAFQDANRGAVDTLVDNIYRAVQINTEFNHPIFLERLLEAANTPGVMILTQSGRRLNVRITFGRVAGNLEKWARAVDTVRLEKGISIYSISNVDNPDPQLLSHFWEEKYYKTAREGKSFIWGHRNSADMYAEKYWDTMFRRLAVCGELAPFWEILDKGSTSMSSDIGGTPYPVNTPTNFISRTIQTLQEFYNASLAEYETQIKKDVQESEKELSSIQAAIIKIIADLEKIKASLIVARSAAQRVSRPPRITPTEVAAKIKTETSKALSDGVKRYLNELRSIKLNINRQLGDRAGLVSKKEIQQLAYRIYRGEELPTRISFSSGVRIRTKRITQLSRGRLYGK